MTDSLSQHLQIWGFDGDEILFSDGSLGFGLNVTPIDPTCWDDDRANSFGEKVGQFLNSLPPHTDLQFVQDIEAGNFRRIGAHKDLSNQSTNDVATALTKERAQRLQLLDQDGELPVHALKIFVRRPVTSNLLKRPSLFSREKLFQPIAEERLQQETLQTRRVRENLIQELRILGLSGQHLTSDEIARLLYHQWNPSRRISLSNYDPEDLRGSLLFSDVGVNLQGFCIGETHFRLLSLKSLPDQTLSCMMTLLRSLPFNSRLFVTIHVPDQTKEIETLQTQRRIAYSMAVGKRTGVSDIESTAKFQDLETLLEQMLAQGQKVFRVSMNVLLQHSEEQNLQEQVDFVLSKFREMGGAEAMQETLAAFDIFSQVALPNARNKERTKRIKTSNLCDLLPLYGPWAGHDTPRILLRSRQGSLVGFDPFDSSLSSANQLISGGSGSGKSFMTNILLLNMLKENPKVFFVDIGGSYRKLTENLSGQYVDLGVNEQLAVNPFDLAPGETTPSSHKIKFLLGLVELMTKEDHQERLPRLIRAEIEEVIQKVYQTCNTPKLSHVRDLLLRHPDNNIQIYGKILSPWCGDTPFGRFLDRPTTVELKRDIVAFDLKGLESYPELQTICLYIITDLVWREVQADRSRMKFLVFDECWKLLKDESGVGFMEEVFRTFRKYYASAIAISQDLNDFLNSKIASALLPNCPVKWVLLQNQSDFTRMRQSLGLNDNEISLIQSLHQVKGEYSEAFLIAGPNHTVAVIEPTPLELWIATTDPRDLALIEKFRNENPHLSQIDALKKLSQLYPKGAPNAEAKIF